MIRIVIMLVSIVIIYTTGSILFHINPTWQEILLVLIAAGIGDFVWDEVGVWQKERKNEQRARRSR